MLMGRKYKSGHGPDEVMLMPADPREWLPARHLAWKVLELADEMDLSGFGAGYRPDGQGGRPYDPRMMATLLLYCYCRGRRSSRLTAGRSRRPRSTTSAPGSSAAGCTPTTPRSRSSSAATRARCWGCCRSR